MDNVAATSAMASTIQRQPSRVTALPELKALDPRFQKLASTAPDTSLTSFPVAGWSWGYCGAVTA